MKIPRMYRGKYIVAARENAIWRLKTQRSANKQWIVDDDRGVIKPHAALNELTCGRMHGIDKRGKGMMLFCLPNPVRHVTPLTMRRVSACC